MHCNPREDIFIKIGCRHINWKLNFPLDEKVTITAKENPDGDELTYILVKQNEKWYIDDIYDLRFIEQQKARFYHAVEIGDTRESQRISDDMWALKQERESMNLTPEQRQRLSRLFAL